MKEPNPHPQQPLRLRARLKWYFAIPIGLVFVGLVLSLWFWLTTADIPENRIINRLIMPNPIDLLVETPFCEAPSAEQSIPSPETNPAADSDEEQACGPCKFKDNSCADGPNDRKAVFPVIWFDRALARNTVGTLVRVLAGFAIGTLIALPLGILMGAYGPIRHFFSPLSITAKYLPLAAVVPLAVSVFMATDSRMKIGFVAMATVFGLLPAVISAIDEVDEVYLKTAYTLGANQWITITRVLVPIAAVRIYEGLRIALAVAWSYIILVEMLYIEDGGLGAMIYGAQRRNHPEVTYIVIIVIALIGFALDGTINQIGKLLFPYRRKRT